MTTIPRLPIDSAVAVARGVALGVEETVRVALAGGEGLGVRLSVAEALKLSVAVTLGVGVALSVGVALREGV